MKKSFPFLLILSIFSVIFFSSCELVYDIAMGELSTNNTQKQICPEHIRSKAFDFALEYERLNAEYGWGAQDPLPRTIRVDCSGLVIRCYEYALKGERYRLPFEDTSASAMYELYSTRTNYPKKGDLIFMGESNSNKITHIGLVDKIKNNVVYFIDSTSYNNAGVSQRHYNLDNPKIKAFGVMNVIKY